jgi:N-acetylmuramoyl-L-alanine amidase
MKSSKMAEKMLSVTCDILGTKNRGIKIENQSQHNRLGMLHCNNKNAIMMLLEVCFVTNKCDVCKYNLNKDILAERLADVIMSFCQEK